MATTYAQQSLELPSSSSRKSRQDIISALISEYGTFGDDDASIYGYSPISSAKELPPSPPPKTPEKERTYSNDKPLPYGGRLSMRFQLRVDEPASPESPIDSRSPVESQPKRINYRSITRDSKPASLNLLVSNGSTAKFPPTPTLTPGTSSSISSARTPREEKDLPPPPPEKSKRRTPESPFEDPKSPRRLERKDSQQSQEKEPAAEPVKRKPLPPKFTSLLDMKNMPRGGKGGPLPMPRSRNQNPEPRQQNENRDRPSTAVETSRKKLSESPIEPPKARSVVAITNRLPPTPAQDEEIVSKAAPPPPAKPTKKPFAGMGLPSNPRGLPSNPRAKHVKGKSSTGFDWMKGSKSGPSPEAAAAQSSPAQTELQVPAQAPTSVLSPVPSIITPGPTPTPKSALPSQQLKDIASPMGDNGSRRPFSFEAVPPPAPPPKQQAERPALTLTTNAPAVLSSNPLSAAASPSPASQSKALPLPPQNPATSPFPPRSTSRLPAAFASLPSQQSPVSPVEPNNKPSVAEPQQQQSSRLLPSAFSSLPFQQRDIPISPLSVYSTASPSGAGPVSPMRLPDPSINSNLNTSMTNITIPAPFTPSPSITATPTPQPPTTTNNNNNISSPQPPPQQQAPIDDKPFQPLTTQPLSTNAAPITAAHLSCYTQHAQSIWSKNEFQPQACMACPPAPPTAPTAPRECMWACTWCYLRICMRCAEQLRTIPGRDLRVLVEKRKVEGPYPPLNINTSVNNGNLAMMPRSGSPNGGGKGGVMSMLIEEPEVEEEKVMRGPAGNTAAAAVVGGVEMPKRHDSGAGGGNVNVNMNINGGAEQQKPNPTPWKANEERYGGVGYESEEDFS